jgi:hypothetical protein
MKTRVIYWKSLLLLWFCLCYQGISITAIQDVSQKLPNGRHTLWFTQRLKGFLPIRWGGGNENVMNDDDDDDDNDDDPHSQVWSKWTPNGSGYYRRPSNQHSLNRRTPYYRSSREKQLSSFLKRGSREEGAGLTRRILSGPTKLFKILVT